MSGAPPPADLQDRIFEFFEELRHGGFRIGVREHVAARKLLVALRAEEKDTDLAGVGAWLAPIVCASPGDQATFDEKWSDWVARQTPRAVRQERVAPSPDADLARRWRRRAVWAAMATAIFVVSAIAWRAKWFAAQTSQAIVEGTGDVTKPSPTPAGRPDETLEGPVETVAVTVVGWTRDFGPVLLLGHTNAVRSVAFSPDGKLVASGGDDRTVRLWSVDSGTASGQPLTGHASPVQSVAFSPDGTLVASGGADSTLRFWSVEQRAERRQQPTAHSMVLSVAFSPDGKLVASGGVDGTVQAWSVDDALANGQRLTRHTGGVSSVVFSPAGDLVASGGGDGAVRLWSIEERAALGQLMIGPADRVSALAFSPSGSLVASGEDDGTIRLWNVEGGTARGKPLTGDPIGVMSVAFSPDGKLLASGGGLGSVRLWSVEDGAVRRHLTGHQGWVASVAFSPDGKLLASGGSDGTIRLWSVAVGSEQRAHDELFADTRAVLRSHDGAVASAVFSPDGSRILTASRDGTARLFDIDGKELAKLAENVGPRPNVAFAPDGEWFLATSGNGVMHSDLEGSYAIWEAHEDTVNTAVFFPDGERWLTASEDGTARLFDVGGKDLTVFRGHTSAINTAAFSPNADLVVTASDDGTARVFDIDGKEFAQLRGHGGAVNSAVFSPDGERIVTAGDDHTARVFNLGGKELAVFRGHEGAVRSATFSSDGERVLTASADGTAVVWNKETREPLRVLRGHGGPLNSAVFDPDDRYVLTASNDKTARLWDAREKRAVSPAVLAAAIAACVVLFALLRALFRRWSLQRRPTEAGDIVKTLPLPVTTPIAADALVARRHSVQLRRAALVGTADVDVERTVDRTIDGAGFVHVVRRGRPQIPEYLVLVERASPRDHLARHVDERLARLRHEGILVERMSYRGEPSVVFVPEGRGRFATLADLHARHPGHRVWALGEARIAAGAAASDARWLEDFADWPHRSFVVPERADATPELAAALARRGVRLAALDDPVATLDEPGRMVAATREGTAPFPPSLAVDVERWMSPTAPDDRRVRTALDDVRRYLGPDLFRWCAACAVYPELHYELTLQMARLVLPGRAVRDDDVVRLARLPWFRRGRMPDWWRRELLATLPADDEARVRDWFVRAFTLGARDAKSEPGLRKLLELPIAYEARGAVGEEFRDVKARARKDPSADPALRDAVFLSCMRDPLALQISWSTVRELFRRFASERDRRSPTPRPWWRALIGALVAGFLLTCWRAYFGGHAEILGMVVVTPYAVLTAAARCFQAGSARAAGTAGKLRPVITRALLFCELEALFAGSYMLPRAIAPRAFPEGHDPHDVFAGLVGAMVVLAWITFELLAFRVRRKGGSTRFERIADALMLDRLFGWIARDFSRGEKPADVTARPWLALAITQVVVGTIVVAAWAIDRRGAPHEWIWACAGLLLAVFIGASALSSHKVGSRYGWLVAATEVFCAWSTVLIASASMSIDVNGTNGAFVAAGLAIVAALAVAGLAALRRRRHPLFAWLSPLLVVCDFLAVGRWVEVLVSKLRAGRMRKAPEATSA